MDETPDTPHHVVILDRASRLLIGVGLADSCVLACCLVMGLNYPSPLNLFALLGGLLVRRGNLNVSIAVAWYAALLAGGVASGLALVGLWMPWGLTRVMFKLHWARMGFQYLLPLCDAAFLVWVFGRLRSRTIREAIAAGGQAPSGWRGRPALGFACGALSWAALVLMLIGGTFSGQQTAVAQARKALPGDYAYFAIQFSGGPERFNAVVAAYNDHELHWIPIRKER